MAGLVPAIHVFLDNLQLKQDVDARDSPGMTSWEREQRPDNAFARHFLVLPESFTASKVANSTL